MPLIRTSYTLHCCPVGSSPHPARSPQSAQSVPKAHSAVSEPGPPSLHISFSVNAGLPPHVFAQVSIDGALVGTRDGKCDGSGVGFGFGACDTGIDKGGRLVSHTALAHSSQVCGTILHTPVQPSAHVCSICEHTMHDLSSPRSASVSGSVASVCFSRLDAGVVQFGATVGEGPSPHSP